MNILEWVFGRKGEKAGSSSTAPPRQRLADHQEKIVAVLRSEAVRQKGERIEALGKYREYLKRRGDRGTPAAPPAAAPMADRVRVPLRCTITKPARELLTSLAQRSKLKGIEFPDGIRESARVHGRTQAHAPLVLGRLDRAVSKNRLAHVPEFVGIHIAKDEQSDSLRFWLVYPTPVPATGPAPGVSDGGLTTKLRFRERFRKEGTVR